MFHNFYYKLTVVQVLCPGSNYFLESTISTDSGYTGSTGYIDILLYRLQVLQTPFPAGSTGLEALMMVENLEVLLVLLVIPTCH